MSIFPERLSNLLHSNKMIEGSEDGVTSSIPEAPAIPLPPVSRPVADEAAHLHDIAFGGSESPTALIAQKLFENQGVLTPQQIHQAGLNPTTIRPLIEVKANGGVSSRPIIAYFAEER